MKPESKFANRIAGKEFIITAEYLPRPDITVSAFEADVKNLRNGPVAVNVADNHFGVGVSSLAASIAVKQMGIEPVLQMVTRDRNRIALQSDLLGAAFLGIKNVLCLSGYHQTLIGSHESANVYDIDSIQLIAAVKEMNSGHLPGGMKIDGPFSMLIGATANPNLTPLELNIIRLAKKIAAGADFIQTQAVFDLNVFQQWMDAVRKEGVAGTVAIVAGVLPLKDADEAEMLNSTYTDYRIPDEVIKRMKSAGNREAQKKEGIAICVEVVREIKKIQGVRGIHILSGGNEAVVPEFIAKIGV